MSILETYKEIVSQVYKLTQLSYQHQDTTCEFDSFLSHLQDVLERKQNIHIPPHVEIINEPVVVVKDDTVKNITLRHIPPSTQIQEDERLDKEENELIHNTDDTLIAKEAIDANLDEDIDIEEAIADAEAAGEEAIGNEMESLSLNLDKEDDQDEGDGDEDQDQDLYIKTHKKTKYFVSMESKRVYNYINDNKHGEQVGKLENGKIVIM